MATPSITSSFLPTDPSNSYSVINGEVAQSSLFISKSLIFQAYSPIMSQTVHKIASINTTSESWNLKVRLVRLWKVFHSPASKLPYSMEMVLQDAHGDRIHASVPKTLIYKFQRHMLENRTYMMSLFRVEDNNGKFITTDHKFRLELLYDTHIMEIDMPSIPTDKLVFTPIGTICSGSLNQDRLVDVVGVISRVGTALDISKNAQIKSWVIKIELSVEGSSIECSLFDNYYHELQSFMDEGQHSNVVLAIQFAKINVFMGKICLQSIRGGTKLFFNCHLPEAIQLTQSFVNNLETPAQPLTQMPLSAAVSIEQDLLVNNSRKYVEELKHLKQGSFGVVLATVKHLTGNNGWWYMACNVCTRGVYPDNKMYFCEKCWKHVIAVGPKYRVRIKVFDETEDATFVIFDREATTIFGKSCSEMIESLTQDRAVLLAPKEIESIVGKVYLFKVENKTTNSTAFEPSYAVKKMTDDAELIKKFQDMSPKKNLLEDFSEAASTPIHITEGSDMSQSKRTSEEICDLSQDGSCSSSFNKKLKGVITYPESNVEVSLGDDSVFPLNTPASKKNETMIEGTDSTGKGEASVKVLEIDAKDFSGSVVKCIKKEKQ